MDKLSPEDCQMVQPRGDTHTIQAEDISRHRYPSNYRHPGVSLSSQHRAAGKEEYNSGALHLLEEASSTSCPCLIHLDTQLSMCTLQWDTELWSGLVTATAKEVSNPALLSIFKGVWGRRALPWSLPINSSHKETDTLVIKFKYIPHHILTLQKTPSSTKKRRRWHPELVTTPLRSSKYSFSTSNYIINGKAFRFVPLTSGSPLHWHKRQKTPAEVAGNSSKWCSRVNTNRPERPSMILTPLL